MTTEFDGSKHPRGQPDNAGKFKRKPVPTPPKATLRRRQPRRSEAEAPSDDRPKARKTYRVMVEPPSAERYAVEVEGDKITAVAGPMHHSDPIDAESLDAWISNQDRYEVEQDAAAMADDLVDITDDLVDITDELHDEMA